MEAGLADRAHTERPAGGPRVVARSRWLPIAASFACGFAVAELPGLYAHFYAVDGTPIYTLYMGRSNGRGGHDEVRLHVATFDLGESSRSANREKCERVREILQNRTTTGLVFWCEAGRFRG